ncbi:hypothetical protein DY000_02008204 [Brassica cretica]|uniref:Secreted protein n=1 Tax=Brassica cretica TaxID=69181 RepID=A0ABQ7C9V1_BRACR|nr:hypothetical protein DY000_02008204 [Brassica cretica]
MRSISSPLLLPLGGGRFSAVGCAPAGAFHQVFGLRKPCPRVQLDCPESRNQVFYRVRALEVPRGALLLAFTVKANISFIWSSIAVSAVTVDTFPAGFLSALPSTGVPSCVCWSLSALVVISD